MPAAAYLGLAMFAAAGWAVITVRDLIQPKRPARHPDPRKKVRFK